MPGSALAKRLSAVIAHLPTQAEAARLGGVTEGTLINWQRGLGFHDSTLARFAENLGVSVSWLRDGKGDEQEELGKFSRRIRESPLSTESDESSRVREDPATPAMLPAPANCQRIIEHLTHGMTPERLTTALSAVMNDQQLSAEERRRTGQALTQILSTRLSREHESRSRKN